MKTTDIVVGQKVFVGKEQEAAYVIRIVHMGAVVQWGDGSTKTVPARSLRLA